jgi:hypothetical protein
MENCYELTADEREQIESYTMDLHEVPEDKVSIPTATSISQSFSREDPRLRSELYKKALYHVSHLKRLQTRGFEVQELQIVLDLDKTLVHCIQERLADNSLALQEARKRIKADTKLKDLITVSYFHENSKQNWIVAQRPGLVDFLRKLMQIGTLYICTQAEPTYAREVVKAIDPNRTFFADRVNSQSFQPEKSLRAMFGSNYDRFKDRIVVIDDQPCVWSAEDQPHILHSYRFNPLLKYDTSLSKADHIAQKTLYYLAKGIPPLRHEFWDFSEPAGQFDAFVQVLRHLHRKSFVTNQPISTLLQELRHSRLQGRSFSLAGLQEPRKAEKRMLFEHIIQTLGGTLAEEEGEVIIVENNDSSGVQMWKLTQCWFMLKEL